MLTSDWPVPRWEFRDALIARIERTMLDAENESRSFAELRELFVHCPKVFGLMALSV